MTNMNTHIDSASRRARLAIIIASLLAFSGVLAGCSSGDYAESPAGAPAEDFAGDGGDGGAYADGEEGAPNELSTANRSIIITGSMYMTVEDPIAAADQASNIVQSAGGRIDARSETAPDEDYGGEATLTMRIPSKGLDGVIDDLRELGEVDSFTTNASDVTAQAIDLDSRISTLRASTTRIEGLLAEAKTISDIITLENELAGRQAELESLEAQQRGLEDQVSMSTITLSLTTEPVVIVVEDTSPDSFWDGLVAGWNAFTTFISVVLIALGIMLPWLVAMALVALLVIVVVRKDKSRKARRAAAAPSAPPAPAPEPATLAEPPATK